MLMSLYSLVHTLPCQECRGHWKMLLDTYPPDTRNSCTLQIWALNAHNRVNQRLGKPHFTPDQYKDVYADAIAIHHHNRAMKF